MYVCLCSGSRPWRLSTGKLGHITAICAGDLFNLGANVLVVISAGNIGYHPLLRILTLLFPTKITSYLCSSVSYLSSWFFLNIVKMVVQLSHIPVLTNRVFFSRWIRQLIRLLIHGRKPIGVDVHHFRVKPPHGKYF